MRVTDLSDPRTWFLGFFGSRLFSLSKIHLITSDLVMSNAGTFPTHLRRPDILYAKNKFRLSTRQMHGGYHNQDDCLCSEMTSD
jgi:hypothetical protein